MRCIYVRYVCPGCGSAVYINIRHDTTIQKSRPVVESEWISDAIHENELAEKIATSLREKTDLSKLHTILEQGYNISPEYSRNLAQYVAIKIRTSQIATH